MKKLFFFTDIIKKQGIIALFKIFFLKLLQKIRKRNILKKPFKECNISKEKKFFTKELYNKDLFLNKYSGEYEEILRLAGEYLRKKFFLLGKEFTFGNEINWHYDPVDKKEWDNKIYDERDLHYPGSPKDPKIVWELNRQQYLFTLAKAFYFTGEKKYADGIFKHIISWINNNPFGKGINWASPLEISIRLISWIFALDLIQEDSGFNQNINIIYNSIYFQTKYLSSTLSIDRAFRTNHLLGELAGLFLVSVFFNFKQSDKWRKKALNLFNKELQKQIFKDGVSKEQSTSYHRFDIDFALLIVVCSNRFNIILPVGLIKNLEKMSEYLMYMTGPDGKVPGIGDSDDGRGIKFSDSIDFWDMRAILSTGSVLFGRGDMKYVSNSYYEETFWFFGWNGYQKYETIEATRPVLLVKIFPEAGHYIVRNSYGREGDFLFIRGGEYGMGGDGYSSHSHDDLLSPVLYLNGQQILVDSGTYVYNGNILERNKFRTSPAHNAIQWPFDFPAPKPNFGWKTTYNSKLVKSDINERLVLLEFILEKHPGYKRIFKYEPSDRCLTIEDHFDHSYENLIWRFHLSTEIELNHDQSKIIFLKHGKIIGYLSCLQGLQFEIEEDFISLNYGLKSKIKKISLKKSVQDNETILFKFINIS